MFWRWWGSLASMNNARAGTNVWFLEISCVLAEPVDWGLDRVRVVLARLVTSHMALNSNF
jgi:hypothetical protein